jgi:glycosyltransferase involved in cell wall biosynthesis
MVNVAAITSGKKLPSTRYRIRQYIGALSESGINLTEFCPMLDKWASLPFKPGGWSNRSVLPLYAVWQGIKLATRLPGIVGTYRSDITWLNKELLPGYSTLEWSLKNPLVTDVDDAIWLTPPFGNRVATKIAQRSEMLIVGNDYLADWFGKYNSRIKVIPTAVDASYFVPAEHKRQDDALVVGWIGSQGNLPYLLSIEPALKLFFSVCQSARLLVVSDSRPDFKVLSPDQVEFRLWEKEREVSDIQQMDVGLMPLVDSEWARGKCSFKMLQYMAVGLPVVVSPVGMNSQVLGLGEVGFSATNMDKWVESLEYLANNRDEGIRLGINGRQAVKEKFDLPIIAKQLADIFHSL